MTGRIIDTVKLEIDRPAAQAALEHQLRMFAADVEECRTLFAKGEHAAAYRKFPYHSPVAKNLEEFCNVFANAKG